MRFTITALTVGLLAAISLGSCTQRVPPPCPGAGLLRDAASITAFREGPGRDITDIDYKATFFDVQGACEYFPDESRMTMSFQVIMNIEPGPTVDTKQFDIPYFAAVVKKGHQTFDRPGFRNTFTAVTEVPETRAKFRFADGVIDIELPLTEEIRASEIEVIFGFQLTEEQLQYNRAALSR